MKNDLEIKIERRKVSELIPSVRNSRTHSEDQVKQIAASIKEFGFLNPVLIDSENNLIAGHGRVLAAENLRLKTVPAIVVVHLDETQRRALAIADNKIPLNAGWDTNILKLEIDELMKAGADVQLVAFSGDELAELFGLEPTKGKTADDYEPPEYPIVSKLGDLWELGDHRLLCGSATNSTDVKSLMDGQRASMLFTDPPYGISWQSEHHSEIEGDSLRGDSLVKNLLVPALKEVLKHCDQEAGCYIWHGVQTREDFSESLKMSGLKELAYIIWAKPNIVLGGNHYRNSYEPCFYAARDGVKPKFYGGLDEPNIWRVQVNGELSQTAVLGRGLVVLNGSGGKLYIKGKEPKAEKIRSVRISENRPLYVLGEDPAGSIWEISKDTTKYVHPTQKPVELSLRAIQNSSLPGEIVLDPFLGSGSTLIGAEKLKRKCYGMDIDPKYVDTIIRRWQDFTGKDGILFNSNGRTYESVRQERVG